MDLSHLRKNYGDHPLLKSQLVKDPYLQFQNWLKEAIQSEELEPNAMILATATSNGKPSSRTILLKELKDNGLIFYTNFNSRKAKEIQDNPFGSLTFFWKNLQRQVTIEGKIEKLTPEESADYFSKRPRGSQLGARASDQDTPIASRDELNLRYQSEEQRWEGKTIECPNYWGGYRLIPDHYDFWQGRSNRLHDRFSYTLQNSSWIIQRLCP